MYIKRKVDEVAVVATRKMTLMSVKSAHCILGHSNRVDNIKTMVYLGHKVSKEEMPMCEACAVAKARMKNLPTRIISRLTNKEEKIIPKTVNKRVFLDIMTIVNHSDKKF